MRDRSKKMLAVLMVSLMAVVALAPLAGEETDAAATKTSLYGSGSNQSHQQGNNSTTDVLETSMIGSNLNKNVIYVAASPYSTFFITEDHWLYGMGKNSSYQMGNNSTDDVNVPTRIGTFDNVAKVFCSTTTVFIITTSGEVWGWGSNSYGEIGVGSTSAVTEPTRVGSTINETFTSVYPTDVERTYFLTSSGKLYGCGSSSNGGIGLGSSTSAIVPTQIGSDLNKTITSFYTRGFSSYFITSDGALYGFGNGNNSVFGNNSGVTLGTPTQIGTDIGKPIVDVALGSGHTIVLTNDNEMWGCGGNNSYQLGDGTNTYSGVFKQLGTSLNVTISKIACNSKATLICTSDGDVYAAGTQTNGSLTFTGNQYRNTFTQIATTLDKDITDIILTDYNTYLKSNDGCLYGIGSGGKGQLGNNSTSNSTSPVQMGADTGIITTCVAANDTSSSSTVFFLATLTTYDVTISNNNSDYGSVSAASATVPSGTTISASTNTITLGTSPDATVITATPTAADAQYTYAFDSWTGVPAGGTVTEDLTITANFTRTVNEYTITWKIGEETDTTSVAYGSTPTHADPTPPEGYYFAGWDPEIVPVTEAATYTALFSNMTVTFDAGKGTLSGPTTMNIVQGQPIGDLPTPTPKAGYTFIGWFDSEGNEVTSETIVTETESFTLYAQYELDDSLKPVKAMTDLIPLIFVVGIILLMLATGLYYYRP